MAIVNVLAPRQANISPVLNFMLQMSSLRERKETRKLQERQVAVDEAALESRIGQAVGAGKQSTALARHANAQADAFIKETDETFNAINTENRRQLSVLTQLGVKEDIIALKEKSARDREVQTIWDEQPNEIKFNIAHADQLGKLATAENRGLTASNNALMQQIRLGELAISSQAQQFREKIPMYTLAGSFEDPVKQAAAISALGNNDRQGFQAVALAASEDVKSEKGRVTGEAQALKQTTTPTQTIIDPSIDSRTEYSPDAMTSLRIAQDTGSQPPELRKIKVKERVGFGTLGPYGWIGPKQFQVMTEQEARSKGFGTQWDAQNITEPVSVKEGVKSAVKKTTGTKKTAPAKETTKQITDSRGWIKFVSPDGVDTWVNPKDVELAKTRGYTLGK